MSQVFSVERIAVLQEQARSRLAMLNLHNVQYLHGDGYQGWPEQGPFDAIIVTAAPPDIPQDLLEQMADKAKLVIPTGPSGSQQLILMTHDGGDYHRQVLERVSFVPLKEGIL